ncbi:MAG TPA: SAM-dependent methyltransferase [Puia sp.]|jgi:SAM-dependent MidA family methyltransferase|nr:SAM-dependent methyltransferase [Puia sp.]
METGRQQMNLELSTHIREHIRKHGAMSFRDFMETALYHPELGYYMRSREKIGQAGDFYTSSCLGPVFGAMIAKQLAQMWELSGESEFTVVEFGAGTGMLCQDILDYFRDYTTRYGQLSYVIIEKSPVMREKERALLPEKVCWHDSLETLGPFTGCVLSNELLDNFAVHQVVMQDELMEVFVDDRGGLVEILRPAASDLKDYFAGLEVQLPEGHRSEINLEALDWLRQVSCYIQKGFVITIDYGYLSGDLYSACRSRGTLLCYNRHRVNENFFMDIGCQDITSHVNFSALRNRGREFGLNCCGLTTQAEFLLALNFKDYLRSQKTKDADVLQLAMQEARMTRTLLIDMGSKFKVLIQHKGMQPVTLTGLTSFPKHFSPIT